MSALSVVGPVEKGVRPNTYPIPLAKPREWFSPQEVAEMVGKDVCTIRDWCRLGRIDARKRDCGRGSHRAWEIHAEAIWQYLEHGLRAPSAVEERASC